MNVRRIIKFVVQVILMRIFFLLDRNIMQKNGLIIGNGTIIWKEIMLIVRLKIIHG